MHFLAIKRVAVVAVLGVGLQNLIISVGIGALPSFIRLVRSSVLTIRELTYVEAARASGVPDRLIMLKVFFMQKMSCHTQIIPIHLNGRH